MHQRQVIVFRSRFVTHENEQTTRWVCGFPGCRSVCKSPPDMEAHVLDQHTADNAHTDYEWHQCDGGPAPDPQPGGTCCTKASKEDGAISTRSFVVSIRGTAPRQVRSFLTPWLFAAFQLLP